MRKRRGFPYYQFYQKVYQFTKIEISKCFQNFAFEQTDQYYESIGYLPELQDLQIEYAYESQQKITEDFQIKRANCLNNKKNLQKLQISSSQIDLRDQTYIQLFSNIKNNTKIQFLDLNLKSLQKQCLSQNILESFEYIRDLKQLSFKIDLKNTNIILVNNILEGIGKISSLKQLNLQYNSQNVYQKRKHQLALSHLKGLNLQSLEIQIGAIILGKEFQELGQVLQKQANLENLNLNIQFEVKLLVFSFGAIQLQNEQSNNKIESFEDFIEGIKNLQSLKQLKYGITRSQTRSEINEIQVSIQHLQSLESIEVVNIYDYELAQIDLLLKSISFLKNLKKLNFDNLKQINQATYSKQLKYFSSLKNLEHLDFTSNCIQLPNYDKIGYEQLFSNLTKLLTVNLKIELGQNQENQEQNFFKGLSYLQNLQILNLNLKNYEFTEKIMKYFSQACEFLINLTNLTIWIFNINNYFTLTGATTLQEAFFQLKKLKFFDTHFLTPNVEISKIIEGFFKNKYLNHLYMQIETKEDIQIVEKPKVSRIEVETESTQFPNFNTTEIILGFQFVLICQEEDFCQLYDRIKHLQNLKYLQILHDWDLLQNSGEAPIQNIKYLNSLQQFELTFKNNNLMNDYLLFDQFQYFKQLQLLKIDIQQTSFSQYAAISLGLSLQNLKQLLKLNLILLNICQIGPEGAAQIGKGIGCQKYLSELKIQFGESCQISEIGAIKLAEGISMISQLQNLVLDIRGKNNVGKQGGVSLASSIRNSKNLRHLFFQILKEGNDYNKINFKSVRLQQLLNIPPISSESSLPILFWLFEFLVKTKFTQIGKIVASHRFGVHDKDIQGLIKAALIKQVLRLQLNLEALWFYNNLKERDNQNMHVTQEGLNQIRNSNYGGNNEIK
ncbi:hypothetical protein ABPG72_012857 [Tetrahymena utriculariae]